MHLLPIPFTTSANQLETEAIKTRSINFESIPFGFIQSQVNPFRAVKLSLKVSLNLGPSTLERIKAIAIVGSLILCISITLLCGWSSWRSQHYQQAAWQDANQLTYLALETKFLAADLNGWQTAYAFDIVRGTPNATQDTNVNRRHFLEAATTFEQQLSLIREAIVTPEETQAWQDVTDSFQHFIDLDRRIIQAYRSHLPSAIATANDLILGQEIELFTRMIQDTEALTVQVLNLSNQKLAIAAQSSQVAYTGMLISGLSLILTLKIAAYQIRRCFKYQTTILQDIKQLATTDALTGIANRRVWDEELQRLVEQAYLLTTPLTVVLLDLDYFKRFNDSRGHQAGDQLLKNAAQAWSQQLRHGDLIARYGGEEFGLLLPRCSPDNALKIIERLRPVVPDGQTFSAGVAAWDGHESPNLLVSRVDQALYQAKALGRNCAVIADATSPE